MTHSPSPWRIRRPTESEIVGGVRKYPAIVAADGFSVCSFGATAKHGKRDAGTVEADACLATAAPCMLAALRLAERALAEGSHESYPAVCRAIARAEGRTA